MKTIVIINYNIYAYLYRPDLKISGGAELQIATLAKLLCGDGYKVVFFTGNFGQEEIVEKDGFVFIQILDSKSGALNKTKNFLRHFRELKPDIILERGPSPTTFFTALLAKLLRIPFVFCGASDINFAKKEIDPVFSRSRFKQKLYQWSLPLISGFVVQKQGQATLLKKNFKITGNATLIRNFPPEIDAAERNEVQALPSYDAVWLANLIPYKQPELFIELARHNPVNRFLMIGASKNAEYNAEIMKKAEDVPNLTMAGYIPHSQVLHWLKKSKMVVNTTQVSSGYEEGFSNVLLMGWMLGLPTLTLISDPDNLLVSNKMGFRSGSFEQLCIDFRTLVSDTCLYIEMSRNAIDYVRKHHNKEKILDQYLQLFEVVKTSQEVSFHH